MISMPLWKIDLEIQRYFLTVKVFSNNESEIAILYIM